ncbi:TetR/AcrR family transcriptional regulator [Sphingomonas sp.]|uniref:TetR/AcrR family transcriptional regulator n=1 Tax=Sphingomonas sp. TaxID=28214 RepID=UPI002BF25B53|nr:TetR/AcrR family transcriptional regulator [Sphingomonas sp.]HWK36096.1 TetR/AcrR family transcriptional regulator [Sphingomonas sp.]
MESLTAAPAAAPLKGRPREFCVDQALAAALRVFWSKGYEGASLTDLTAAMGITRPSLYAAFGNKESLFRKALDLYQCEKMAYVGHALERPTARAVAEHLLRGSMENATATSEPHGCLGVITSVACGPEAESIREEVLERSKVAKDALIDRMERAKNEGDLPAHIDVEGLTSYLYAIMQGMAVQAGSGATRAELERLIDTSLAMWPSR